VAVADPHHVASGTSRIWNYPNPFNPSTTIVYELSNPSRVTLRIFDASGRAVRSLIDGSPTDSGQHRVRWDGTDGSGRRVESGVYFGHPEIGTDQRRRRMVLVK
jgi:flagellar hook assembly protein FlgD